MSLYDKFIKVCGTAPLCLSVSQPSRKVGMNYVFKYGKYKGKGLLEVILIDKQYIINLLETGDITLIKKDEAQIRKVLYNDQNQKFSGIL